MTDFSKTILSPRSVALIGASADPNKNTGRPQRFLKSHGYKGDVYPINPRRAEVQGAPAFKSVRDIVEPIDTALIMVHPDHVVEAVRDCAAKGMKLVTIYSDGFAEAGDLGKQRQQELSKVARELGIRVLGPNSMGILSPVSGLTLSVNAVLENLEMVPGRLGLISQSGTILGTMLSRGAARGIGFSHLISVGNESDIGVGELIDAMVDDESTDAVLLFLEGIRDAPKLAEASRRAFAHGKPVIAYKLGKSSVGQQVALSHSGALAGEDAAVDAFFRAHGIVRVETLEALFELPPLLLGQSPVKRKRVAVMTTTGGGASTVVDRLGAAGLDLVPAPEAVHQRLRDFDLEIGRGPLIDLTMAGTRDGVYGAVLEKLLKTDACDAVVCVVGSSAQFHPELAVTPIVEKARNSTKPVAAFMVPDAQESLRLLANAGIASFRTPESCADAVRAYFSWRNPSQVPSANTAASSPMNGILDEAKSLAFFRSIGVPVVPFSVIKDGAPLEITASKMVVKALSDKLPHKTEAGAVKLGLQTLTDVQQAINDIKSSVAEYNSKISLTDFLIAEMVSGIGEVLIGYRHDPQVGPIVVLASGGVLAELYGDSATRCAPIDHEDAMDMIHSVKGLAPLLGYRNLPKGDIDALADALVCLSSIANMKHGPKEAEINPLVVREPGNSVVAVDGLVIFDDVGKGGS